MAWLFHSHGTTGVSLAFDLRNARPPEDSESLVSFAPCVYDSADKENLLMDALHHGRDEIRGYRERIFRRACERDPTKCGAPNKESVVSEYLKANPTERESGEHFHRAAVKTRLDCFKIAALLKNASFKEEKEWRLVLPTLPEHSATMKNPPQFRVAKNTLVPYVAHPLATGKPLPLVDVILGPGSDENAVFSSQRFLQLQGINVKPRLSTVPYRASQGCHAAAKLFASDSGVSIELATASRQRS